MIWILEKDTERVRQVKLVWTETIEQFSNRELLISSPLRRQQAFSGCSNKLLSTGDALKPAEYI